MYHLIKKLIPKRVRTALRVAARLRRSNPALLGRIIRRVRLSSLLEVLASCEDEGGGRSGVFEVRVRGIRCPLVLRPRSSDFAVFREVVINDQYALPVSEPVEFIVDAGANIGLSSVTFLERYPRAKVLAIEPDPENFAVARRNLEAYGERCLLINAAVWSENGVLAVSRGTYRDGREWATQTVPAAAGSECVVPSFAVQSLLEKYKFPRIDILKIDIEGAELQVFRDGDTSFLHDTRCCAVECHGFECYQAYSEVVAREGFQLSESGELTIAVRRDATVVHVSTTAR